jgi:DNA uptake protein ComE-like DNA-binding protein
VERGRGILERVGRLYQRLSGESPGGVEQDPAEGREPERDNPAAGAEQTMSRLEFPRPHRSKEGMPRGQEHASEAHGKWDERVQAAEPLRREIEEREVKTADERTGAEAQPWIDGPGENENVEQQFAEAERRLEEIEGRVQAAEQLAVRAEHVAGLHADKPVQVRRASEAEPDYDGPATPDTEAPEQAERPAENGDAINLQTASYEDLRELGMSITQAKRVLDFRERNGAFNSVDDLDRVPGFSRDTLIAVKQKLVV